MVTCFADSVTFPMSLIFNERILMRRSENAFTSRVSSIVPLFKGKQKWANICSIFHYQFPSTASYCQMLYAVIKWFIFHTPVPAVRWYEEVKFIVLIDVSLIRPRWSQVNSLPSRWFWSPGRRAFETLKWGFQLSSRWNCILTAQYSPSWADLRRFRRLNHSTQFIWYILRIGGSISAISIEFEILKLSFVNTQLSVR